MKKLAFIVLIALAIACRSDDTPRVPSTPPPPANTDTGSTNTTPASGDPDINLLFVGNSLSYYNNMPDMITEIGESYDLVIDTECLCAPNYALLDHWAEPDLRRLIESGNYDYVILQQGPSSLPEGASWLRSYGQLIKDLADQWDVETAFYQVWPSIARYFSFEDVIQNYANAAKSTDSELFPVGAVWKSYIDITGDESLYGADRFHPSRKGSFLAAWVIFHSIRPGSVRSYGTQYATYMNEEAFNAMNDALRVHGN